MEKKELEEKLRGLVIFTEGDGQGQATNTTLEEELGEYAMQKVLDLFSQELDKAREEEKKNIFTEEELRYLLEIIQLDYSLATMYQQREKSDIGGKLLRVLSKLTTK